MLWIWTKDEVRIEKTPEKEEKEEEEGEDGDQEMRKLPK
jgi:hypothetical protein